MIVFTPCNNCVHPVNCFQFCFVVSTYNYPQKRKQYFPESFLWVPPAVWIIFSYFHRALFLFNESLCGITSIKATSLEKRVRNISSWITVVFKYSFFQEKTQCCKLFPEETIQMNNKVHFLYLYIYIVLKNPNNIELFLTGPSYPLNIYQRGENTFVQKSALWMPTLCQ